MTHRGCLILGIVLALPAAAQTTRQTLASILGFENGTAGQYPAGWGGTQNGTIFIDNQVVHSGRNSARIERTANSPQEYSTLTTGIPLDFAGKTIEWRGFLRTENVNGYAALWLREDGNSPNLAFSTLQDLNLNGTRGWTQYSISVPVLQQGTQLWFGFLLTGTGKAWVDDLQLLVDGVPVGNLTTPFDTDHEFDAGSRIAITSLSSTQIRNLATLAKVWGFLKYHHPAITVGTRHWDYDLFRVLPQVLAAADSAGANLAMSTWIANLGPIDNCTTCTSLDSSDLHLTTNLDWIGDETLLGSDLSQTLRSAYRNRRSANRQFFVSLAPSVFNPSFDNEPTYPALRLPDSGYQLLALFRFWNMVQYFYPNRNIMSDDATATDYWSGVLEEFIPAIGLAPDSLNYQQQMLRFIAKINDTHANLWSSLAARPPRGSCQLPVDVRFVEGHALVLRLTSSTAGPAGGLMPGDVIDRLDGRAVTDLVGEWWQFYADSNDAARWRDIAQYITHGACGPADVAVRRGRSVLSLRPSRVAGGTLDTTRANVHDLPGNTFQMLASDVAYLKLSSVQVAQSADYIASAAGTKGLIIDIRNYPSEYVVYSLGQLLVSQPTDFVRFTNGDLANPSAFHWGPPLPLLPTQPHYDGKVVILVDEVTQSQAEYTTMAFRTAPGAIVIGSTTAGADGNVSTVPLPGGLSSLISGIGVFYPDKRPTQRVGIIPDIVVTPTIEGIRAGRDELIEEAVRQIRGLRGRPPGR